MNKLRRIRRKENTEIVVKNAKIRVKRLWLVMITFIFSAFAWMAYMRFLQPNTLIHVAAWQIEFKDDEGASVSNPIDINVENFCPGMQDYEKVINIDNLGEKDSYIYYNIDELSVIGNSYVIKDAGEEQETDSEYTIYRSTELDGGIYKVKLFNNYEKYPFEVYLEYKDVVKSQTENNTGYFKIRVSWPYDAIDRIY